VADYRQQHTYEANGAVTMKIAKRYGTRRYENRSVRDAGLSAPPAGFWIRRPEPARILRADAHFARIFARGIWTYDESSPA
jgi:hypothetical protein